MFDRRIFPSLLAPAATLGLFVGGAAFAKDEKPAPPSDVTRIACVGDSITAGSGTKKPAVDSYPAQLNRLYDQKSLVRNFGVGGATLMNHGDKPYQKQKAFAAALDFDPQIVVIMLGTNDTKPQNWKFKDEFVADYKDLIEKFAKLPSKPKIYLCKPVPVPGKGNFGIVETGVDAEIPLIESIAKDESATVIDMHAPFDGKDSLLPDRVHPNTEGAAIMAKTVYQALTGKAFEGDVPAEKARGESKK